jgi:gluconate 5-dehydrogenase
MNVDLIGLCAVITGSSSGLGLSMAEALLAHGATVAISARPGERLDRVVGGLKEKGFHALKLPMDVRSEAQVASAASQAMDLMGKIDLLVNNAGIGMPRVNPDFVADPKPFFEMDTEGVRDIIETNFIGYFTVSKYFVQPMLRQGRGRIVNISTSLRTMTMPYGMPYGPARAGAEALATVMAEELKQFGITVNTLLPGGAADTPMMTEKNRADFLRSAPLLEPSVMKKPILFLASPQAGGITGERIIAKEFDAWLRDRGIEF